MLSHPLCDYIVSDTDCVVSDTVYIRYVITLCTAVWLSCRYSFLKMFGYHLKLSAVAFLFCRLLVVFYRYVSDRWSSKMCRYMPHNIAMSMQLSMFIVM